MRVEDYLHELADGTVKQRNPFTGTEVWTVPGRGNRPLGVGNLDPRPLIHKDHTASCAFCQDRYLDTPPEKSRLVRSGSGWEVIRGTPAEALFDTVAEFRRVPNLFEILSFDYWRLNYGFELPEAIAERRDRYLASAAGRAHVLDVVRAKLRAGGVTPVQLAELSEADLVERASGFFGGGHDVIIARRHFVEHATDDSQLASAGTLSLAEHRQFIAYTADSTRRAYELNPHVRFVSVFQNWLKPAGASFDHLHKQLVAIDEIGSNSEAAISRLATHPDAFNDDAVNYATVRGLLIAHNEYAVAFAGFGHRYPTIEVFSRSAIAEPWAHSDDELAGVSDVLHAMHAALGAEVACNEEWHYKPPGVAVAMPWRVVLKLRVSTLAGFEGATKIYLNTVSPHTLRDRIVAQLRELRDRGEVSASLVIADAADLGVDPLRYRR